MQAPYPLPGLRRAVDSAIVRGYRAILITNLLEGTFDTLDRMEVYRREMLWCSSAQDALTRRSTAEALLEFIDGLVLGLTAAPVDLAAPLFDHATRDFARQRALRLWSRTLEDLEQENN